MEKHLLKDESFFEELFRQYYKSLKAYALKYVNDKNTAEDIVQDVFFELWLKRDSLSIHTGIKPYLFKAITNKSLNLLKKKEESNRVSLEDQSEIQLHDFYLKSLVGNQEDLLLLKELNDEIKACIERLPPQCKRVFILKHHADMKNKEIADLLNISIKAVEKHVSKALFEIRKHLQGVGLLSFVIYTIIKALS